MIALLLGIGRKFLPYLVVFAAVAGGVLYYGHTRYNAGEASVQAKWDRAVVRAEEAARVKEAEHDTIRKGLQDELVRKSGLLDAAESRGRSLADRLRGYQARACVPKAPGAPPGTAAPGGEPADSGGVGTRIDEAVEAHFVACARDAERLLGWQDWHRAVTGD